MEEKNSEVYSKSILGKQFDFIYPAIKSIHERLTDQNIAQWNYEHFLRSGFLMYPAINKYFRVNLNFFNPVVNSKTSGIIACLVVYKCLDDDMAFKNKFGLLLDYCRENENFTVIKTAVEHFDHFPKSIQKILSPWS